jgi:ubiquinone/menaquinone biosynthesis C-methylase UbiE
MLPPGVDAPLWQYAHTERLAADEAAYFGDHPLFRADRQAVLDRFRSPGRVADLGCGTGRMSLALARRGFQVTAVELSAPMLGVVSREAALQGFSVGCVRANLCRLPLPDAAFDHALSLFSTLGMIRGPRARQAALREAARILRPGGRLALHAHNIAINLDTADGRRWLLAQLLRSLRRHPEAGDREMTYRGIPAMKVHLYRWSELRRSLRRAGFRIDEVLPIRTVTAEPIPLPRLLHPLRAGGWLVFASR